MKKLLIIFLLDKYFKSRIANKQNAKSLLFEV